MCALAAVAPRLEAQTYWRVPAALGGALVGAGVGYVADVAIWSKRGDTFGGPTLVGTTIGIVGGGIIGWSGGLRADRRLARGDTLSRGTRRVLRLTTFLAPVAIGSAVAFAIINPSPDPYAPNPSEPAVDDATVALLGISGGVVIGYVLQHKTAKYLWPRASVGVAPARDGGVSASIRVPW